MKLIDLVKNLIDENSLAKFYLDYNYLKDSENILIYMADTLDIHSDLFVVTEKQIGDLLEFKNDGRTYYQLFPIELGVEFYSYFDAFFAANKYTNEQKAQRILEYVINDA